jgi:alpha-amylase
LAGSPFGKQGDAIEWANAYVADPAMFDAGEMKRAARDAYLANAYVLGRDGGVPMVYSDHGESGATHPEDHGRWQDLWRRADIAGMLAFHNAMHGTPGKTLLVTPVVLVKRRGDRGVVVINKSADWQTLTLEHHGLCPGTYVCDLHGHAMTVSENRFDLQVPPRQAQLWRWQ